LRFLLSVAAYDTNRKRLILHGGAKIEVFESLGNTWAWTVNGWVQVADDGVGARDHHAIAFDAKRNRGVAVRRQKSREPFAKGYVAVEQFVVGLYGGFDIVTKRALDDLWEWDGQAWAEIKQP
jgi:hypothetical protein